MNKKIFKIIIRFLPLVILIVLITSRYFLNELTFVLAMICLFSMFALNIDIFSLLMDKTFPIIEKFFESVTKFFEWYYEKNNEKEKEEDKTKSLNIKEK